VGRPRTVSLGTGPTAHTHPSTSVPLVLPLSMYVILPLEFMNMPWVIETSESLRRLIPWFLNCFEIFCGQTDGQNNIDF